MFICACGEKIESRRVVLCIPVYGQSLALGEEAKRITDFDSLAAYANGRIVTENLDHNYGYFDNDKLKQFTKKLIKYQKRAYELSIYSMAKTLADSTGNDTLICIFPGGQGATTIANLSKGTKPYQRFMDNIKTAHTKALDKDWKFLIPAICWMQGESDIVDYPKTNYKEKLTKIWEDMNTDIRQITGQQDSIRFICYQANSLSRAEHFDANNYQCKEVVVPQAIVELLRDDNRFWASGPTYPYNCVGEKIHIDASGQQAIGKLSAHSILGILQGKERFRGLIPIYTTVQDTTVIIHFIVPNPPLTIDTIHVNKADNYGFRIINNNNKDITTQVTVKGETVIISCSEPPQGCNVRYAVNGDYMKSGNLHGPRGNLRDSRNNWCYMFDIII